VLRDGEQHVDLQRSWCFHTSILSNKYRDLQPDVFIAPPSQSSFGARVRRCGLHHQDRADRSHQPAASIQAKSATAAVTLTQAGVSQG